MGNGTLERNQTKEKTNHSEDRHNRNCMRGTDRIDERNLAVATLLECAIRTVKSSDTILKSKEIPGINLALIFSSLLLRMKGVFRLRIRLVVCSQQLMLRICKHLQLGEAKPHPIGQQRKESSKVSTAINLFITEAVYLQIMRYSIKLVCVHNSVFRPHSKTF